MLDPCEFGAFTRISLRCIGSQRWIQDIGWLLTFGDIEGAKILGNMEFEPQGENLSLIMVEGGKGENKGRFIIENRIDELNIHKKPDNWGNPQVCCLE